MIIQGEITRVFLPRGFAFVTGDDGRAYFLHAHDLNVAWGGETVHEGVRVAFRAASGAKGLRAVEAHVLGGV